MKALVPVLVTLMMLVGASSAHAAVWDLSWSSQWDGLIVTTSPPGFTFGTGVTSGQSTATITPTSSGITINFDTAAGVAQLEVDKNSLTPTAAQFPNTRLPFNVPVGASTGPGLSLLPGGPQFFFGQYSWTGDFDNPQSFQVHANENGSGPAPRLDFIGTGVRTTAAAAEPGVLAFALTALGAAIRFRRNRWHSAAP